ncbi:hypothetical protein F5Y17DRAFT_125323 [Xylariaceae sp. FL0594]|nr:hypothetical protein F5Y17DRAFT_125323 [Xylariaceae sp. FL0594]
MISPSTQPYICARCAFNSLFRYAATPALVSRKHYSTGSTESSSATSETQDETRNPPSSDTGSEPGRLARRLEEATEEVLLTGGKAGRRAVEDAGFSEELKERLFAKVKDAEFRSEHAAAFAEAGLSSAAGQGTRMMATSRPWTGQESTEDTVLRMLTDAHKPLKPEFRGRPNIRELQPVDMRMRRQTKLGPGHRAVNARDKAAIYAGLGIKELEKELDEQEKEARRKELRERFEPAARAVPATLTGLASLANERIEDAIARGQFKNIPRGKGIERDARSDNPFIDTTEYIMNKMIKRQDIVPPWIEKQQELSKAAHSFRTRLRNDWKRHAARTIASKGGPLEDQMERARMYARAEAAYNPRKRNVEQMAIPTNSTDDVVMAKMRQGTNPDPSSAEEGAKTASTESNVSAEPEAPLPPPLRDPDWLKTEQSYLELAIANLNTLTRSYNLMAPELAKKPYFTLERELNNCYADVAPFVADAIRDRATRPANPIVGAGIDRPPSILDRFGGGGHRARVHDSKAPHYGFKEMWRDLFSRSQGG